MIVIADTSPLNYLGKIGQGDILKKLYGTVICATGCAARA